MAPTRQDKTRLDKTRLCHINSNPSSQGDEQVLEKSNSCTKTCVTRRLVVNSWQMPLAMKPAHASRHAACHSTNYRPADAAVPCLPLLDTQLAIPPITNYRPADAAVQCLPFLSRLNVRCDVLWECLQKCLYQRRECLQKCLHQGRDPQADRCRTTLAKV